MTDRDAPTLPPPPEPFREPAMVHDTEPPLSPAIVDALRLVVREEVDRAVGALAKRWGESHVALSSKLDETKQIAKNAIELGKERDRAAAERERTNTQRFVDVSAILERIEAALVTHQRQPMNQAHGSLHDLQDEMERAARGGE